jgi:hypothetical protein
MCTYTIVSEIKRDFCFLYISARVTVKTAAKTPLRRMVLVPVNARVMDMIHQFVDLSVASVKTSE